MDHLKVLPNRRRDSQTYGAKTEVCTALCCVCIALQSFCNANVDQILRTVKTTNNGQKINNSSSYTNKFCQPLGGDILAA